MNDMMISEKDKKHEKIKLYLLMIINIKLNIIINIEIQNHILIKD